MPRHKVFVLIQNNYKTPINQEEAIQINGQPHIINNILSALPQ